MFKDDYRTIPIIRSRRKTLALQVDREGNVLARAPLRLPERTIRAFIAQKQAWIEKQLAKQTLYKQHRKNQRSFETGECFWFLGEKVPLKVFSVEEGGKILNQVQDDSRRVQDDKLALRMTETEGFILAESRKEEAAVLFGKWYRARAREILSERMTHFSNEMQLKPHKIRINSARTRWGSCSAQDNLNFSWRLIQTPLWVVDYVVVHELAHIPHKHHQPAFWRLVEAHYPDYRNARRWLKEHHGELWSED